MAGFLLLWKLGSTQLSAWDESIYAEIASEIVHSGHWLTLLWQHQLWFEKPPLFLWMMAGAFKVFGTSEFTARLVPALCGIVLALLTYETARRSYGRLIATGSALILLTCSAFVEFSRETMTDIPLCLFIYLSLFCLTRIRESQVWWIATWVAFALAALVKGPAALVCVVAAGAYLPFERELRQELKSRSFWVGFLCALAIVVPWHAFMLLKYGHAFFEIYFVHHVIDRSLSPLGGSAMGALYEFRILARSFRPWSILLPFAIVLAVKDCRRGDRRPLLWLLLPALVMGVYTIVQTKLEQYIIPVYPALSILTAVFLARLSRKLRLVKLMFVLIVCAGLLIATYKISRPGAESDLVRGAKLARIQPDGSLAPLLFCTDDDDSGEPAAAFYSGRPVLSCMNRNGRLFSQASSPDAAWIPVTGSAVLVKKNMVPTLPSQYAFTPLADAGQFEYGDIRLIR